MEFLNSLFRKMYNIFKRKHEMNNNIIPKYQFYISKLTDEGAWIAEETPVFADSEHELKQLYQMTGNTITIHRCELNPEYITKNSTNRIVKKPENVIQPVVDEQPNAINNSTEINGDISKMKFKIGDYPTDNVKESDSYNHFSIEQLQNTSIKKERRYSINGTNFKVDANGKLFVEKWVNLSEDDPKIRIVYNNRSDRNGTSKLVQMDGKHIEILKWVEAGEDCE